MKKKSGLVYTFLFLFCFSPASAKTIELKVSSWSPPQLPVAKLAEEWGRKIEEKSGGTVKLVFFWSQTLASYKNSYRAMQTGVADIGNYIIGLNPGIHPLNEITNLPMLDWKDIFVATKVYHEMRRKFPEFDVEFMGLRNIYSTAMPPYQLHFARKKNVNTSGDMRGLRMITNQPNFITMLEKMNATAIALGPPDWYMALQKGLAGGNVVHWPAVQGFKLEELYTSHTEAGQAGFGTSMYGWWINEQSWNKLPPRAKQAFIDLQDWVQQKDNRLNNRLIDQGRADAEKMGHPIHMLSEAEIQAWRKVVQPIHDEWISKVASKGLPAKKIYDEFKKTIQFFNEQ